MMKSIRLALLLCLLAIAAVAIPVAAQEDNPFGLSADDWALFQSTQAPESFAYDFTSQLGIDVDGDGVSWDLTGSGLVGTDSFAVTVDGTLTSSGEDTPIAAQVRVVDGSLYFSVDGDQWAGGTLDEITQMLMGFGSMMGGSLPVDPEDLASGDMSGLMSQPGVMEAAMGLSTLDPSTFTTITRLDDVDGSAHFQTTLSLGDLLASPELAPLIGSAMGGAMGGSTAGLTPEQAAQMSAMFGQMFTGSTITLDQYMDPATGELQHITLTINITLPAAMGIAGAINLSFDVAMSDPAGATVEAPASFEPISEGMGAIMGGM